MYCIFCDSSNRAFEKRLGKKGERPVVPTLYVGEKDENDGVQMMLQGKLLSLMLYWWIFAQTIIQRVNPSVNSGIV